MMPLMSSRLRFAVLTLLGCATTLGAYAQQTPLTGQMGPPSTATASTEAPAAAPPSTPPAPVTDATGPSTATTDVGSTTRQLFAMQSQGTNAGRPLPIPGQEASASYQRYLKSFAHPIPEFYETAVSKNGGLGASSSGMP